EQLRGYADAQRVDGQIVEPCRRAFDRLWEAIGKEVDAVLGLDDLLPDDQLLALVPVHLGLEPLDRQFSVAAGFLPGPGGFEACLEQLDGPVQGLHAGVERHQRVITLSNLRDQTGHEVVPPLTGGQVACRGRVPGVAELPPYVRRPEKSQAEQVIW